MDLGIDIGGTFIKYAWIDEDNNILKHAKKETKHFQDTGKFYDYLLEDIDLKDVKRIGVSAPGVVSADGTMLTPAAVQTRDIYKSNVPEEVSSRTNLPCSVVNDAKSAGFCEMQMGNGKGTKSSVYFVIGTGIGGCVCDDEKVIEGMNGISGEFSNLPVGVAEDGRVILAHEKASMTALIDIYNAKADADHQAKYGTEISDLYLNGDETAVEAMEEWMKNILYCFEIIQIFYDPEIICVGGGISKADWFIEKLQDMNAHPEAARPFESLRTMKIDRCKYDNDANILGAVLTVRADYPEV